MTMKSLIVLFLLTVAFKALPALSQRPITYTIRRREVGRPSKRQQALNEKENAQRKLNHNGIPDTREYYCGKKNTGKKTNDKKNEGEKTSKKADKKYQCVSDETPDQTQPTTGSLPTTLLRSTFASTVDEDEESPSNEGEDVTEATDPATTGTRFETLPTDDEDEESPSNEGQDVSESTEAATTGTEFETAPTDEDDESPGTEVSSTAFATTSTFFAGGSTSSTPFSVATVDADEDEESPSNEGTDVSAPVDEDVEESPSNEGVDRGGPAGGDPVVIGIPDLYYEDAYENYVEDEDEEVTNEDFK